MPLMSPSSKKPSGTSLRVAGMFAGIGGIELGLSRAGHRSCLLCEIDPAAGRVLSRNFPDVPLTRDVRDLTTLPRLDLLAAGFPCQDLSQAGRTAGIRGRNSGLVGHIFRLLDQAGRYGPRWLLLENVSFMLHLDRGRAMRFLIDELESRGYAWAYRVVDSQAFGLPQRRQRVVLLASRTEDARKALLSPDAGEPERRPDAEAWRGFYWTEGTRGLGWAVDAVPTLKGGSTIGIPSPPAIWNPATGSISTPDIRDAERLQGFEANWTLAALEVPGVKPGHRWKLVGNAVSVPVARWVGDRLTIESWEAPPEGSPLSSDSPWPRAAWGSSRRRFEVRASMWPVRWKRPPLSDFLRHGVHPLSERAAAGFLARARAGSLRFEPGFLDAVEHHVRRMRADSAA